MTPEKSLPSLILCISLLLQSVSSEPRSHWTNSFRRALSQQPQDDSNAGDHGAATSRNHPPHVKRQAREFLEAHNKVRMMFNQPPLRWDKKLARHARRWGARRAIDCKMIHSYGPYGENLFWGAQDHWTPTEAVASWAREGDFYDAANNACALGQMCGHYTQIVWRDSVKLGCARVNCAAGGVLLICEYDPPGNYVDESPFGSIDGRGGAAAVPLDPSPPSTTDSSPTTAA